MLLEWATKYATAGWYVFPCRGKYPYADYDKRDICNVCGNKKDDNAPRKGHSDDCITPANGLKDATINKNIINLWWKTWPKANIALATGIKSNVIVIDIDGEEGYKSLAKIRDGFRWDTTDNKNKHWVEDPDGPIVLESGMRVKTGKGEHLYFSYEYAIDIGNSASKLGPCIDVRGEGGYVILPPSVHPETGGIYEWL